MIEQVEVPQRHSGKKWELVVSQRKRPVLGLLQGRRNEHLRQLSHEVEASCDQ